MASKKIGIVGLGNAGTAAQIPAFRSEGWEVAAVAAAHKERAEAFASENGIGAAYGDLESLLKHPGLDAIGIATPPAAHRDMVIQALDAGKHVLLEKPFTLTTAEAEELRAKARSAQKTAMIAEAFRFSPSRAYVKELVEQGYIGQLQTLAITLFLGPRQRPEATGPRQHWRSSNSTGGGFSAGPASTFFDSVLDWFGDVARVNGKVYEAHPGARQPDGSPADADESMAVNFELANGGWGSFTASLTTPFGQGAIFDLMGTEGTIRLTHAGLLPASSDKIFGGRFDNGPQIAELTVPDSFKETVSDLSPKIEPYHAYQTLVRRFTEGVEAGTSPGPNFEDAYQLQRITDAIRESSATGRWVKV